MTLPTGRVVTYTRDGLRRIEQIETSIDGTLTPVLASSTYQADNQITSRTYANGLIETRTYDLQGRLEAQDLRNPTGPLEARTYTYDPGGNLTGRNRQAENRTYTYDGLDRLVQEALEGTPTPPTDYAYDPNGNRLARTVGPDLDDTYTFTRAPTAWRSSRPSSAAAPHRPRRTRTASIVTTKPEGWQRSSRTASSRPATPTTQKANAPARCSLAEGPSKPARPSTTMT
jgi:YD repeat-containing protein